MNRADLPERRQHLIQILLVERAGDVRQHQHALVRRGRGIERNAVLHLHPDVRGGRIVSASRSSASGVAARAVTRRSVQHPWQLPHRETGAPQVIIRREEDAARLAEVGTEGLQSPESLACRSDVLHVKGRRVQNREAASANRGVTARAAVPGLRGLLAQERYQFPRRRLFPPTPFLINGRIGRRRCDDRPRRRR